MTERIKTFVPTWEGAVEGWAVNFAHKNLWRVAPEYEFADLMQEARYAFLKVKDRYPEVVDPPHFMRLFQTVLRNNVHRLSSRRSARKEVSAIVEVGGDEVDAISNASRPDSAFAEKELELLIADAPENLRPLLRSAVRGDLPGYLREPGRRETTAQYLQRVSGLGPEVDVLGILRRLFNPEVRPCA